MEEIKSKLSPMEQAISATLVGFCKTLAETRDERILSVLDLNITSACVVMAALKEYVDNMEGKNV